MGEFCVNDQYAVRIRGSSTKLVPHKKAKRAAARNAKT